MNDTTNATNLLIKAISFAAEKHRNQRRKDAHASPYINHPIALADVLANEGNVTDINVLCAAILHDTIEDHRHDSSRVGRSVWAQDHGHCALGDRRQVTR
jgi:(p)ppGpp synthase/HD superfamily hydrolase